MATGPAVRVGRATLPSQYGSFTVYAYDEPGVGEHVALVLGHPRPGAEVLVRLHSSCVTGDVFASLRCDCGQQLDEAMRRIASVGTGVVLYLDQEGRGIGLANKIRAYQLQDAGSDTVDANTALGFGADQRDYAAATDILRDLGVTHVRLLSNNPRKVDSLRQQGITVDQEPLVIPPNRHNRDYLATKARRLGHHIPASGEEPSSTTDVQAS